MYDALYDPTAVNGTELWLNTDMTMDIKSSPGHILMSGYDNGLPNLQDWRVMHLSD